MTAKKIHLQAVGGSDEWYTPRYVFDSMGVKFDLDVASPKDLKFIATPTKNFISEKSIETEWKGFIWCNPPYANYAQKMIWVNKFIEHGNGIMLMPDRTSCGWWQLLAYKCDAILFVKHKIKFINEFGVQSKQPANGSCLFAIGEMAVKALIQSEINNLGYLATNKKFI